MGKFFLFSANQIRSARYCGVNLASHDVSIKRRRCWKACATSREFQELLEIDAKKFGILPAKVLSKYGAGTDDIEVIRDGDHLIIVSSFY